MGNWYWRKIFSSTPAKHNTEQQEENSNRVIAILATIVIGTQLVTFLDDCLITYYL